MITSTILRERRANGLRQHEIARPLGKTEMWLSLAERGLIQLRPETEKQILLLIRRLSRLNEHVARRRAEIVEDVRAKTATR